jgi:hypothetical protein
MRTLVFLKLQVRLYFRNRLNDGGEKVLPPFLDKSFTLKGWLQQSLVLLRLVVGYFF